MQNILFNPCNSELLHMGGKAADLKIAVKLLSKMCSESLYRDHS